MDRNTLNHVAHLARLTLTEQEADEFAAQLSTALKHFEQIAKINTSGVEPLITPTNIESHWREDEVQRELTPEEIVANAPTRQGQLFSVPPVV